LERVITSSARDICDDFFADEEFKGFFRDLSQDLGDPNAPGTALTLAYFYVSDLTDPELFGIPKGGMGAITQAMEKAARSYGVAIMTGSEVEKILVSRDAEARGVRLKDGREFASEIVVSNTDVKKTFLNLVGEDFLDQKFVSKVKRLKNRASCIKFHSAIKELPDLSRYLGRRDGFDPKMLAHIFPAYSLDYFKRSWDDSMSGRPTRSPIIQVQIPTVYDASLAPSGQHVMSMWVRYEPYDLKNGESWDDIRQREGEFLIDTLSNYAPNVRKIMIDWQLRTPLDLERIVGLTGGNIRHIDMIPGQTLWSRPIPGWADYKTPIKGLYLCGADTHPGGEVTGAPGHNSAQVILQELQLQQA
jgi:phytoene dehydrogenase-like protein